jgi:hypothetical protein
MFELGKLSVERNLKVGVGLMCRHCIVRGELLDRIRNGEIGDLLMLRAYRMAGPTGSAAATKQPEDMKSELLYQLSRFHGFLWASGGAVSDFLIHNIDECCWMKEDWPVNAVASGGRHYRNDCVDQNFDSYSIEYTFADGTKMFVNGRTIPGCHNEFASYAHGTKGSAVISASRRMISVTRAAAATSASYAPTSCCLRARSSGSSCEYSVRLTFTISCSCWLLEGAEPDQVLAVTFTRLAAHEMRERLSGELRRRKVAALTVGSPQAIATANIGCLEHLRGASPVPVRHWIELVADALDRLPSR